MSRATRRSTQLFEQLKERYGKLDALVHSVAFAPAEELKGDFVNTSREGFRIAHDISAYSLVAVGRAAAPLMTEGGSIITMTYYGAEKVVPEYNVMGVAKAALEAMRALPGERPGQEQDSRQCDFRGADQDTGCSRNFRLGRDDEGARVNGRR